MVRPIRRYSRPLTWKRERNSSKTLRSSDESLLLHATILATIDVLSCDDDDDDDDSCARACLCQRNIAGISRTLTQCMVHARPQAAYRNRCNLIPARVILVSPGYPESRSSRY